MSPGPGRRRQGGSALRGAALAVAAALALTVTGPPRTSAAPARPLVLRIGVSLALTGPDARYGLPMLRGVELAVEDVNQRGAAAGSRLETVVLDSAGPGLEGISRWRGMNNYERFIADPTVVAAVGPQTTGEARAAVPLLSRAGLATITPSATTFDVTDPATRDRFRPGGEPVFFRTVGTDLVQGDAMARFAHDRLAVRRIVLIDDGTEFGVRMTRAFARRAEALGMAVLARQQVPWTEGDYRPKLHQASALNPDALYFSGSYLVGVKIARQAAEVLPWVHRLGAESLNDRAFAIQARGSGEGWFVSNVAPDPGATPAAVAWADRYRRRFGTAPTGYALTAYTAVTVIGGAAESLLRAGRAVTRASLRAAIAAARLPSTPQGPVAFDENGDLTRPVVSIYRLTSGVWQHVETVTEDGAPRDPGPAASS